MAALAMASTLACRHATWVPMAGNGARLASGGADFAGRLRAPAARAALRRCAGCSETSAAVRCGRLRRMWILQRGVRRI